MKVLLTLLLLAGSAAACDTVQFVPSNGALTGFSACNTQTVFVNRVATPFAISAGITVPTLAVPVVQVNPVGYGFTAGYGGGYGGVQYGGGYGACQNCQASQGYQAKADAPDKMDVIGQKIDAQTASIDRLVQALTPHAVAPAPSQPTYNAPPPLPPQPAPNQGTSLAPATNSLTVQSCASCHSAQQHKGGLVLDGSVALTSQQRLDAIAAVTLGKMPKGKPLSGDALGQVILELSGTPAQTLAQTDPNR